MTQACVLCTEVEAEEHPFKLCERCKTLHNENSEACTAEVQFACQYDRNILHDQRYRQSKLAGQSASRIQPQEQQMAALEGLRHQDIDI